VQGSAFWGAAHGELPQRQGGRIVAPVFAALKTRMSKYRPPEPSIILPSLETSLGSQAESSGPEM